LATDPAYIDQEKDACGVIVIVIFIYPVDQNTLI
jgi:hypothetical protein